MKKVAVVSQKGGVGKTTTAVSLAAALAEAGWRVLVIDLDAQGSAGDWLGVKAEDDGLGLLEALTEEGGDLSGLICESVVPGVDVIPAGNQLMGFERATAGEVGSEFSLKRAMERMPERWDLVLYDCPRSLEKIGVNAITAADGALVPVQLNFLSLRPLGHVMELIGQVRKRLHPELRVIGVLGCLMDSRKNHPKEVLELMKGHIGEGVFASTIRDSVRFSEASAAGQPITVYDPRGIGAEDFRQAAAEFAARLGRPLIEEKEVANG